MLAKQKLDKGMDKLNDRHYITCICNGEHYIMCNRNDKHFRTCNRNDKHYGLKA